MRLGSEGFGFGSFSDFDIRISDFSRAVFFLLHFPYPSMADCANTARHLGRWELPTTASCGARTFLSPLLPLRRGEGAVRGQRPSGRPANRRSL